MANNIPTCQAFQEDLLAIDGINVYSSCRACENGCLIAHHPHKTVVQDNDEMPAWAKRALLPIYKEVVNSQRIRLDPWTPSKVSSEENQDFKKKLIYYYGCSHPTDNNMIKCMILDVYLPKDVVIGSHIYKACTYGRGLEDFGLKATDLFCERNGLLLYQSIEKAFDVKEVCFLYNSFTQKLELRILNSDLLMKNVIYPYHVSQVPQSCCSLMFKDINGTILQTLGNAYPYKRILSWHARLSVRFAVTMAWITQAEADNFQPYFDTSNGAQEPTELEVDEFL